MKRVKDFLRSVGDCSLIYHSDSDGLCSAVLMSKFLEERVKLVSPNDSHGIQITQSLLEEVNKLPYGIFLDLAVDQWDFKKIKPKTLVIDHHTPREDLNKFENFVHVNPRLKDPKVYIPTSQLVFDILSEMKREIKKYSWIAAVGIIGDKGDLKKIKLKEKFEDLKLLSDIIESCKGVYGYKGVAKAYKVFMEAKKPSEVLNSNLIKTYHKFQKEVESVLTDFRYRAEYFEKRNAYLYKISSRYNITSVVSTILSEREPDAAFFVYKKNKVLSMSARCQTGRINLAELFKKICKDLGSGGGHPQAAAANIPLKHAEEFLERLKNFLEGI